LKFTENVKRDLGNSHRLKECSCQGVHGHWW